jgi:tRNA threonylcarbamoyl adenosine modification protein (Sua5/YciO/YrdC/YwlC family)
VTGPVFSRGRILEPDAGGIAAAVELLRSESVVAFPTETVYGLGADAFSPEGDRRGLPPQEPPVVNPLIVHVSDVAAARALAADWPSAADKLAAAFWPGPLTMVVRRASGLTVAGAANDTIALRIPAHAVALRLLAAAGLPLAAPSANRSEGISPTTAEHVLRSLPEVPLVLDGGPSSWGNRVHRARPDHSGADAAAAGRAGAARPARRDRSDRPARHRDRRRRRPAVARDEPSPLCAASQAARGPRRALDRFTG